PPPSSATAVGRAAAEVHEIRIFDDLPTCPAGRIATLTSPLRGAASAACRCCRLAAWAGTLNRAAVARATRATERIGLRIDLLPSSSGGGAGKGDVSRSERAGQVRSPIAGPIGVSGSVTTGRARDPPAGRR